MAREEASFWLCGSSESLGVWRCYVVASPVTTDSWPSCRAERAVRPRRSACACCFRLLGGGSGEPALPRSSARGKLNATLDINVGILWSFGGIWGKFWVSSRIFCGCRPWLFWKGNYKLDSWEWCSLNLKSPQFCAVPSGMFIPHHSLKELSLQHWV